ncbi:MAG: hypothetical protein MJZ33_09800 [Paludibacteraceae bacterium]|nr:hypothetical protein [Paludibacteraceae bacterium]
MVLLKISGFCKSFGHKVSLIKKYDELNISEEHGDVFFEKCEYDTLVISQVFKFTKRPSFIDRLINSNYMFYGGTGFFEINGPNLPYEVEHFMPDYNLYNDYIEYKTEGNSKKKKRDWDDYLSYSIGFTTRGCIRHCGFCVNRLLNSVQEWSPVQEFMDPMRPKIYLWDDNIMAAKPAVFKRVMDDLQRSGKPFQFRQGMDIRLMTEEKAQLLNKVKYYGDFIFAFDHYRMDDPKEKNNVEQTIRGLTIWRNNCLKATKLYVLVAYDSIDVDDIKGAFFRIKILMEFGCLPYIMRFENYNDSRFKGMYTQLARWCNQPSFFKKMSFRQYCVRNEEYHQGIQDLIPKGTYNNVLKIPPNIVPKNKHCSCYKIMLDFEKEFPEIASQYFDLRYEDLKKCKIGK